MSMNTSSDDYLSFNLYCMISGRNLFIFTAATVTYILTLLPLCVLILYLGLRRWWQQRTTSAAAPASHADIVTYHMVAMELFGVSGCALMCCSIYAMNTFTIFVGFRLWFFSWLGETFFHLLTCLERYLAVVHPVTYLSLRGERGIRLRNVCIAFAWLLPLVGTALMASETLFISANLSLLVSSLLIISFTSLAVLCTLNRPGPGEQDGDRERVDQSKQRAFYTILIIMEILLLRCSFNLVWILASVTKQDVCTVVVIGMWFTLPCCAVLPLLFLYRAGVFSCCNTNN